MKTVDSNYYGGAAAQVGESTLVESCGHGRLSDREMASIESGRC